MASTKDSYKRRREKEEQLANRTAAELQEENDKKLQNKRTKRIVIVPKGISTLNKVEQKRDLKLMMPSAGDEDGAVEERPARPAVLRVAERPAVPPHSTQEEKRSRAIRWQAGAEEMDEEMEDWEQALQATTEALASTETEAEQHRQAHVCLREHLMQQSVALQEQNELCDEVQAVLLRQIAAELAKDGSAPAGLDRTSLISAGDAAAAELRILMDSAFSAVQLRADRVQAAVSKQPQQRSGKGSSSASAIAAAAAARSKQAYLAAEAAAAAAAAADYAAETTGERTAATPLGEGAIIDVRVDGALVVQLAYGTAYLQPTVAVDLSDSSAAAPPAPSALPDLPKHSPGLPWLIDTDILKRWGAMGSDVRVLRTVSAEAVALARVSADGRVQQQLQQLRQLLPAPKMRTQLSEQDAAAVNWPQSASGLLGSAETATVRERLLPTVEIDGFLYTMEWLAPALLLDGMEPPKHMISASATAAATGGIGSGGSFRERYHSEEDTGNGSSSGLRRSSSSRSVTEEDRAAQRQLVATLNTVRDAADGQHRAQQGLAAVMREVRFTKLCLSHATLHLFIVSTAYVYCIARLSTV
jgi:hypothetical protein